MINEKKNKIKYEEKNNMTKNNSKNKINKEKNLMLLEMNFIKGNVRKLSLITDSNCVT
jgi:hypothetical protein